ncbi:MAG: anti-sigma factor [Sphingomicrobium sp.]
MTDDPLFYAWLDGELDPAGAARMEAKVATDPALAALAEQHRALSARLGAAFNPIAAQPVPDSIANAGRSAQLIDFAAARQRRTARMSWGMQAAAMAASLAIGLVVGGHWPASTTSPIASEDGHLVASAALGQALDTHLASAPAPSGPKIGLTFREASGGFCRTFSDGAANGLACREGGRWTIRGLFQGAEGQATDYHMAAGPNPQLMALVDQSITGDPLDAAGEKAAMKAGWQ